MEGVSLMIILIIEILMGLVGLWALIGGKIKLSRNLAMEGKNVRIAGILFLLPVPLAFVYGLVQTARGGSMTAVTGCEFLLVFLALAFGIRLMRAARKPPDSS